MVNRDTSSSSSVSAALGLAAADKEISTRAQVSWKMRKHLVPYIDEVEKKLNQKSCRGAGNCPVQALLGYVRRQHAKWTAEGSPGSFRWWQKKQGPSSAIAEADGLPDPSAMELPGEERLLFRVQWREGPQRFRDWFGRPYAFRDVLADVAGLRVVQLLSDVAAVVSYPGAEADLVEDLHAAVRVVQEWKQNQGYAKPRIRVRVEALEHAGESHRTIGEVLRSDRLDPSLWSIDRTGVLSIRKLKLGGRARSAEPAQRL